jgi:hypothetical protein
MRSAFTPYRRRLGLCAALGALLFASGCSDIEKAQIAKVLDARDQAVSERNIGDFSMLISDQYYDHGRSKVDIVAQMIGLFEHFEQLSMKSHDRNIRILDDNHAQCEQTYTLRAFADQQWRSIVQKEQLQLIREENRWQISGGL